MLQDYFDPDLDFLNAAEVKCNRFELRVSDRPRGKVKWTKYQHGWFLMVSKINSS